MNLNLIKERSVKIFNPNIQQEWIGDFYLEENEDIKFSGLLIYTPNDGMRLHLSWNMFSEERDAILNKNNLIFKGNITQIGYITVLGTVSIGSYINFNVLSKAIFGVSCVIFGCYLDKNEALISEISFSVPCLKSFCSSNTDLQIYNSAPLLEAKSNEYEIQIINKPERKYSLFSILNIAKDINIEEKVLDYLQQKQIEISDYNPYFLLRFNQKKSFYDILYIKNQIAKLFSVLMIESQEILDLKIKIEQSNYSVFLAPVTKVNNREYKHCELPVYLENITSSFEEILELWLEMTKDEFNILNIILTDKLYNRADVGYQSIMNYRSFIEDWQTTYGKNKDNGQHLQNFFEENLSEKNDCIYGGLLKIFPNINNARDFGDKLLEIRDCLGHIKTKRANAEKYTKNKDILENEIKIKNFCEILFIVIIKAIHRKFGIIHNEKQLERLYGRGSVWQNVFK